MVMALVTLETAIPGYVFLLTMALLMQYDNIMRAAILVYIKNIAPDRGAVWQIYPTEYNGKEFIKLDLIKTFFMNPWQFLNLLIFFAGSNFACSACEERNASLRQACQNAKNDFLRQHR